MSAGTPLLPFHEAHARFLTDFAGWRLPLHYGSIVEEAKAVRAHAGIFDVSHMGRLWLPAGDEAVLQWLTTNDVTRLRPGHGQYTIFCTDSGGTVDDAIVSKLGDRFLLVCNASNRERVRNELVTAGASPEDWTVGSGMAALQGPATAELVGKFGLPLPPRFGVEADGALLVARTGYTGADGVEIMGPGDAVAALWDDLVAAGAAPAGLGARDTLRIEVGYPLYGHELADDISPLEADVGFAVKLDGPPFRGQEALLAQQVAGHRRLAGIVSAEPRRVPRQDEPLTDAAGTLGVVTSGCFSPHRDSGIGLALLEREPQGDVHVTRRDGPGLVAVEGLPLVRR